LKVLEEGVLALLEPLHNAQNLLLWNLNVPILRSSIFKTSETLKIDYLALTGISRVCNLLLTSAVHIAYPNICVALKMFHKTAKYETAMSTP
jgi:hypothetical protein